MRTGPPLDDEEDYKLPVWAGVVPVRTELGEPITDGRVPPGISVINRDRLHNRRATDSSVPTKDYGEGPRTKR